MAFAQLTLDADFNPVDAVEEVACAEDWSFERCGVDEISVLVQGVWTDYGISFNWMADMEALHVSCSFDLRVPAARQGQAMRLLAMINEQLVFGHFDFWLRDGSVLYRHAIPLNAGAEANEEQIVCLLQTALRACERYYQAFQYVVWGGRDAAEALQGVLFDTMGEA